MGKVALEKPVNGYGYTPEQVRAGLELAAVIGQRAAARELEVSRSTIGKWINNNPQLWSDLRAGNLEAHRQGVAARLEELADRYVDAEDKALDKIDKILEKPDLDGKTAAALVRSMAAARGVAHAGARTARGEADQNVGVNINFPQLEKAMAALLEQGQSATPPTILPGPESVASTAIEE